MLKTWIALLSVAAALSSPAQAGSEFTDPKSTKTAITGTMGIVFNTRTERDTAGASYEGAPKVGAADVYNVNLSVMDSVVMQGKAERIPWLPRATLGTTLQNGRIGYSIKLGVKNPANPSQVRMIGDWVGAMALDGNGVYHLNDAPDEFGVMRVATQTVGNIPGFTTKFGGKIQGRVPEQAGLWGAASRSSKQITRSYTRMSGGVAQKREVKNADPMSFDSVDLAQGPLAGYPTSRLSGSIDYDPEQGIWYVDTNVGYQADGAALKDRYSGTIRWVDGPNRAKDGAGWYEVNVQLNEKPVAENAVFANQGASSEDAFFASDNQVPGFIGRINYVDTILKETVTDSKVTYEVEAVQASKIQVMNFAKILMLMIGPFNDE
jgi:hypothetical protein